MPELSRRNKQRMAALRRANEVRADRAKLRESIRKGKVNAIALIRGEHPEHDDTIAPWELRHVLALVPGVGPASEVEIYSVGKFTPTMLLSALSPARREKLADLCREAQAGYDSRLARR